MSKIVTIFVKRYFRGRQLAAVFALSASSFPLLHGQARISTFAGAGPNNSPALQSNLASFTGSQTSEPDFYDFALDPSGNLLVASALQNRVFRIDKTTQVLSVVAGLGIGGFAGDNGDAKLASLSKPRNLATDSFGNIYVSDTNNHRIRKVDAITGVISTIAGTGAAGFTNDGATATTATLNAPRGLLVDPAGTIYIADSLNHRIRRLKNGVLDTVAGNGVNGSALVQASPATSNLSLPYGLGRDSGGRVYIAEAGNHRIVLLTLATTPDIRAIVNTAAPTAGDAAGTPANTKLNVPFAVRLDAANNIYIADTNNHRVKKMGPYTGTATDTVINVAGNGVAGAGPDTGVPTDIQMGYVSSVIVNADGTFYIADNFNKIVRLVNGSATSTYAGNRTDFFAGDPANRLSATLGGFRTSLGVALGLIRGMAVDRAGNVFVADFVNHRVRRIDASTGAISTVAGTGVAAGTGDNGDNGPANLAKVNVPYAVAFDSDGNLFFTENGGHRIRRIAAVGGLVTGAGIITRIAGSATGAGGFVPDNPPLVAANTTLTAPRGIAIDSANRIYVSDDGIYRIRMIAPPSGQTAVTATNGATITTFAGTGVPPGSPVPENTSPLTTPVQGEALAIEPNGTVENILLADVAVRKVRRVVRDPVSPADLSLAKISSVTGTSTGIYSGDNNSALAASIPKPFGLAVRNGTIYITVHNEIDDSEHRILQITNGAISRYANSTGVPGFDGDGGNAIDARINRPYAIAIAPSGDLYFSDTGNARIRQASACVYQTSAAALFSPAAGSSNTVNIAVQAGCAWTASSPSSFVTVNPTSGSGPGTVTVTAAANTGAVRTAVVTIAGSKAVVSQAGTGSNTPPTSDSIAPFTGTAISQTFTSTYSDVNGASDVAAAYLLINPGLGAENGCYVEYTQAAGEFRLLNDNGSIWIGPGVAGSAAILQNSQCSLNMTGSSATISGNTLTVTAAITFSVSFKGRKALFLNAKDTSGAASDWSILGNWWPASSAGSIVNRYRLFNKGTNTHVHTTDLNEYNTLRAFPASFNDEGVGSRIYDTPVTVNGVTAVPYYRIYIAAGRSHLWTKDRNEYVTLIKFRASYTGEGVDGFILPSQTGNAIPLRRLNFCPGVTSCPAIPIHHWTTDTNEFTVLMGSGAWLSEGIDGFVYAPTGAAPSAEPGDPVREPEPVVRP